jgi:hypothetical protein
MHYPFDHGSLRALQQLTRQKTILTACGRRVALESTTADGPIGCAACRAALESEAADKEQLAADPLTRATPGDPGRLIALLTTEAARLRAILARSQP